MEKSLFNPHQKPRPFIIETARRNAVNRILVVLFAIILIPQSMWALDYVKFNTSTNQFEKATIESSDYTEDPAYCTWSDETIVISLAHSYANRIEVSGQVNIILCDGATLSADKGIEVPSGAVLTIYAQEKGTGVLYAQGDVYDSSNGSGTGSFYSAAIGAYYDSNVASGSGFSTCGSIVIHGGQITANSSAVNCAAGIGGCNGDGPLSLIVYGGKVTATGGMFGAGIGGGGLSKAGGTVSIFGGEVIATGGGGDPSSNTYEAMGIGRSSYEMGTAEGSNGTLEIGNGVTYYYSNVANHVEGSQTNIADDKRKQSVWTDFGYDLTVKGIKVTASNASNILGSVVATAGAATASFSAATNTLTLNAATIDDKIVSGLANLTIELNGTNSLTGSTGYIESINTSAPLTIKGSGSCSLDLNTSISKSAVSGFASVTLDNVYACYNNPFHYDLTNRQYEVNSNAGGILQSMKFTSTPYYMLWVGSIGTGFTQATDGNLTPSMGNIAADNTVSFSQVVDAVNQTTTNTLTLDGADIVGFIESGLGDLVIELRGSNKIMESGAYTSENKKPITSVNGGTVTFTTADGTGSLLLLDQDGSLYSSPFDGFANQEYLTNLGYNTTTSEIAVYKKVKLSSTSAGTAAITGYYSKDDDYYYAFSGSSLTLRGTPNADYDLPKETLKYFLGSFWVVFYPDVTTPGTGYVDWTFTVPNGDVEADVKFGFDLSTAGREISIDSKVYDNSPISITRVTTKKTSTSTNEFLLNSGTDFTITGYQDENGNPITTGVPTDAGNYYAVITGTGNHSGTANVPFTIDKASATITAANQTVTYNGAAQAISGVSVDKGSVSVTYYNSAADRSAKTGGTTTAPTNKGVYYVQVEQTNTNYTSTPVDVTFTIGAKSLTDATITVDAISSQTYNDGTAITPAVVVKDGGKPLAAGTDYTLNYSNNTDAALSTDASAPTVTITGTGNYTGEKTVKFTISPASATITATNWAVTYNGASQAIPDVSVDKGLASVTYYNSPDERSAKTGGTTNAPTNAGTYYVQVTQANTNYTSTPVDVTFTIDQLVTTLSWSNTSLTYNGTVQEPYAAVTNLKGTDVCTVTVSGGQTNAGSYTATASGLSNANYTLPSDASTTMNFDIDSLEVKLSWSNTSLTYNGAAQVPTATVTNLIGSDACDVIVSGKQTNAGSYTATVIGLSNRNYKMPTTGLSQTFTINAAPGTMTSPTALTLTYTGAEQDLVNAGSSTNGTVEYKLSDDDETKWGTTIPKKKDAGTYTVNYRLKGDSNHDDIASADIQVTIAPVTATLSWSNTSLTYNGIAQEPTATMTNLIGSDVCTVTVSGGQTNAGSYTATASGLSNANYTLPAAASENFTIAPATATLSWSNTSLIYNGTVQVPTATVTNLIGSDVCTVTVSGGQTNAGSYTATASGLSNTNYTLPRAVSETFTINPLEVVLSWSNTSLICNGTVQVPTATVANIIGSDVCTVTVSGGQTNAGSYTATASSLSNTNYTLPTTGLTQNFTISDRTATFAFKTGRTFQTFYAANETFLVPDGVTAYIITGVNGKSVTVTKVSYIQAGVPVLLESTPGSTIAKEPSETIAGNLLKYADQTVATDGNQYVLYSDEFVKASGNIDGKVYLDLTGLPSPARAFVIRTENATAIEDVFGEEADGVAKWYDMQGRRINKPNKAGLYIKDGKKVVVNKK